MGLSWFSNKFGPIAVDIGTQTIKLLQVEPREGQFRLAAAASESIPFDLRTKTAERELFISDTLRKLLNEGFRGKQVVTCLPASSVAIQHLRVGKMNNEELVKALPFEAAGKLPFDPNRAMIRHTVAGEVYQNQEAKQEIIIMAAPREAVERHLNILSKHKLEVVGIHVEPNALIECFGHLFNRKGDDTLSTMFIDMGATATHVVIAHGKSIVFAKHIAIGGDALNKAVAEALKVTLDRAQELRIAITQAQSSGQASRLPAGVLGIGANANTHPLGKQNNPSQSSSDSVDPETEGTVLKALESPLETLIADLHRCLRYYEGIFPGRTADRAIFVGGESRHLPVCKRIAERLGLPATLGDPLARLMKEGSTSTSVDLRQPQPGWAIAVGLATGMGTAAAASERVAS